MACSRATFTFTFAFTYGMLCLASDVCVVACLGDRLLKLWKNEKGFFRVFKNILLFPKLVVIHEMISKKYCNFTAKIIVK